MELIISLFNINLESVVFPDQQNMSYINHHVPDYELCFPKR